MSESNGQNDVIFVGCDDGHAAIKLAFYDETGRIRHHSIPSRADSMSGGIMTIKGQQLNAYTTDNMTYVVGEYLAKPIDTRFNEYGQSGLNRVLVHHALRTAGLGGRQVALCTGLPPRHYFNGAALNTSMIEGKKGNLFKSVESRDGSPMATVTKHEVFPEAIAAVLDWCLNDEGETVNQIRGPVGVVDIGGRTTDVVVVLDGPGGPAIDLGRSKTEDIGVLYAIDILAQLLNRAHGIDDISVTSLENALQTGRLYFHAQQQNVTEYVNKALAAASEKITRSVEQIFGSASQMQAILVVGGGASLFRRDTGPYKHLALRRNSEPQYANARGMLKYIRFTPED